MEVSENTEKLFSLVQPTEVELEDQEQFHEVLSSDNLDNDTYSNVPDTMSNVDQSSNFRQWRLFGKRIPKNEAIFICQVVILYIVIITCILNLSLGNGDSNLWTALLSSSMGIMLPAPSLSRRRHS